MDQLLNNDLQQALKKDMMQALTYEISQGLHDMLYDTLLADLHRDSRNHSDNYPNADIQSQALGQAQYYTVLQAFDKVFKGQSCYSFRHTTPKGGLYSQIELSNLILLPRRSVEKEGWKKANYLKTLAKNNQFLDWRSDLFPETLPNSQKVLVIVDVSYIKGVLTICYLVPSSRLDCILMEMDYIEIVKQFEQPLETDNNINPVLKLKKTLEEVEKIAVNQR